MDSNDNTASKKKMNYFFVKLLRTGTKMKHLYMKPKQKDCGIMYA